MDYAWYIFLCTYKKYSSLIISVANAVRIMYSYTENKFKTILGKKRIVMGKKHFLKQCFLCKNTFKNSVFLCKNTVFCLKSTQKFFL